MKTNSVKAWVLASRPKTLTGAAVPVAIALSLAFVDRGNNLNWCPALLCLLFAFIMQINANFVNDYYDFKKGVDREDRLGPERACSQGWITLHAMKYGIFASIFIAILVGLPLIIWGGWQMVWIGLFCIIFSFLYTTLLSRKALGDVLVLLFFGIVPVCATYYIQTGHVSQAAILLSIGCGLATDNLLIVNNFRDRETDKLHGKITLVTLVGEHCSLALYLLLACAAFILAMLTVPYLSSPTSPRLLSQLLLCIYPLSVLMVWRNMFRIRRGKALNQVLGQTSLTILLYGIVVCLAILC